MMGGVATVFQLRFDPVYATFARPFGIAPGRAWVSVDDAELQARYGPFRVRTPLSNVASVAITGPYRFYRTAGPARLGVTDLGLTFASNGDRGVLIEFHQRVSGGLGPLRHGELTVTVESPEALVAELASRIG